MMTQHSIQEYVSLIDRLLECEEGAEWLILRNHIELLDQKLVELIEQFAMKFRQQGDWQIANFLTFLENIIQKEILIKTANPNPTLHLHFAKFLQDLCHCHEGSEAGVIERYSRILNTNNIHYLQDLYELCKDHDISALARKIETVLLFSEQCSSRFAKKNSQNSQNQIPTDERGERIDTKISHPSVNSNNKIALRTNEINRLRKCIEHLVESLNSHPQRLAHLDVLEKAQANKWLLSTHELTELLGVKPHCPPKQTAYFRGGWKFLKIGRCGRESLWQVHKLSVEEILPATLDKSSTSKKIELKDYQFTDPWIA